MLNGLVSRYQRMSLPAKAGLWFTACSIVQRGISVISMPIFTRMLSTDEYGMYSLYTSWYLLFSFVVTLNLASDVFNKGLIDYEGERSQYSTSQSTLITALSVCFYCVYLLLRGPINSFTGMGTLLTSLMVLDIYVTSMVSLWYARKRFDYSYRPLFAVTVGISLTSVLVGIVAVWLAPEDWKVVARVASNILPYFLVAVVVIVNFLRNSRKLFNKKWWKQSIGMGVPLVPHYASQVLLNQSDKVLISWFMGMTSVAIYGIAHSAALLLVMVNNGINSSFVPWLYGKLKRHDYGSIAGIANLLSLIVLAFVFCLMLLAPECVAILATDDYRDAIWCIPPIATGVVTSFIYTLFVNVEIYYGKSGYVAIASALSAVLNVALNYLVIPIFGYIGSAYVTALCYLATLVLHYVFMRLTLRDAGVEHKVYDSRFLFVVCTITFACAFVSIALYQVGVVRYAVIVILVFVLFMLRKKIVRVVGIVRS